MLTILKTLSKSNFDPKNGQVDTLGILLNSYFKLLIN